MEEYDKAGILQEQNLDDFPVTDDPLSPNDTIITDDTTEEWNEEIQAGSINAPSRTDKYALVTGATSGIGYELAKLLANDGYSLVLVARNKESLQEVSTELTVANGVQVFVLDKDLFEPNAAKEIYDATTQMGITINVLVNDAGQGQWGKFVEIDLQRHIDVIQLNIISLVSLTRLYLEDMVARNEGKILQLSSEASKAPIPLLSVYAATKAFVQSFTEALINELKDTKVTVTALLPGASDTDFFHKADAENTVNYREEPLANPAEVAKDGYEALMNGGRRVITGAGAKNHVMMANLMPDNVIANNMRKKM